MITPGQIYQTCQPTYYGPLAMVHTRIKVLEAPGTVPGMSDFGKAFVATLTEKGGLLRMRHLDARQLHESVLTDDGERRRRKGYYLVEDVVHLQQIGSYLRLCGGKGGRGHMDPGKITCPACHEAYVSSGA